MIVELLKLKKMKAQFETNEAGVKMKVEYFEPIGSELVPTQKQENRTIAETVYSKSGRYTLKTVIYE